MKKSILIIFAIVIIVVTVISVKYTLYKMQYNNLRKENAEFEQYKDKEIYGIELATLINKVVDKNTKNKIEKDNNEIFIDNEENSIQIEIYIKDNDQKYKMETFYNTGMQQFIQYYGKIEFRCSKIEYHKNTGKIKHLLFEQVEKS